MKNIKQMKTVQKSKFWTKYYIKAFMLHAAYGAILILPERKRKIKDYPTAIQLPITYKCNFDCVMCGMRNLINKKDFTAKELNAILGDKLFCRVEAVSVNGGEPFLKKDLIECIQYIIERLPKLHEITIISNGYFTDNICNQLEQIKKLCTKAEVKLHLSLSVDGVGKMQNFHRGNKCSWEHMRATIDKLTSDSARYFDSVNIICTITKYNIYSISDVEAWSQRVGIPVAYNIATENVRIDNYGKLEDFSIFGDEKARQMAMEFFYCKFIQTKSRRYFGIYYYIKTRTRVASCPCDDNSWVTLTPDCQLGYCATHSKELGNALENSSYEIFNGNLDYLELLKSEHCKNCSHYIYGLNKDGKLEYIKELCRIHRCGSKG